MKIKGEFISKSISSFGDVLAESFRILRKPANLWMQILGNNNTSGLCNCHFSHFFLTFINMVVMVVCFGATSVFSSDSEFQLATWFLTFAPFPQYSFIGRHIRITFAKLTFAFNFVKTKSQPYSGFESSRSWLDGFLQSP